MSDCTCNTVVRTLCKAKVHKPSRRSKRRQQRCRGRSRQRFGDHQVRVRNVAIAPVSVVPGLHADPYRVGAWITNIGTINLGLRVHQSQTDPLQAGPTAFIFILLPNATWPPCPVGSLVMQDICVVNADPAVTGLFSVAEMIDSSGCGVP